MRLAKNSSWLLSGSTIAMALSLVSSALRARSLGPQDFGILALVGSYGVIVGRLASLQPWQAVIKFGATALEKDDRQEFAGIVRLGFLLDLVGACLAVIVSLLGAFLVMPLFGWDRTAVHLAAVATGTAALVTVSTPIAVLRLTNRFYALAAQNVLTSGLGLAAALFVFLQGYGLWAFLIAQISTQFVGMLFLLGSAWRALRSQRLPAIRKARVKEWRPLVSFSSWTFLNSTIQLPVKQFDVLMVGSLISVEAAGAYKIIRQVVSTMGMLSDPVYQACYPQFAGLVGSDKPQTAIKYALRLGLLLLMVIGPVGIALAATSSLWLPAVFGEAFGTAVVPLIVFLVFAILQMSALPVHPLFYAFGYARTATAISAFMNGLFLVLALLLGTRFGLVGFAIAWGLAMMAEATAKVMVIRHRQPGVGATGSAVT